MILTPEKTRRWPWLRRKRGQAGFILTFWEVLISVVIVAVVFGLIFDGYITAAKVAQWSAYSMAAQSMAGQSVEQARSAVWDIALQKTQVTNLTLLNSNLTINGANFTYTGYTTNILDIPWKGTNYVVATNYVTVTSFFQNGVSNPWIQMQSITVQTVWPFVAWGHYSLQYYTNTVCTFIAPDNRDPTTLGQ